MSAFTIFALVGLYIPLIIVGVVSSWRIFKKAGRPRWAALIPVYNVFVLLDIVGRPRWWLIFMIVPIVSVAASIILARDLARSFGQGAGMVVLLVLLPIVGLPLLAFGPYTYHGPSAGGRPRAPAASAA